MNIGSMFNESIGSLRTAINMTNLRKAMHQDAQTMAVLLNDMQTANARIMEQSVTPHKGGNVDARA
jgi:hypothetical protein